MVIFVLVGGFDGVRMGFGEVGNGLVFMCIKYFVCIGY